VVEVDNVPEDVGLPLVTTKDGELVTAFDAATAAATTFDTTAAAATNTNANSNADADAVADNGWS